MTNIIRSPRRERDFLIVNNALLQDKNLTMRALGLLCRILSNNDNWKTSSEEISRHFGVGREYVQNTLGELQRAGYMQLVKTRNKKGQWSSKWIVYEEPMKFDLSLTNQLQQLATDEAPPETALPSSEKPTNSPETALPSSEKPTNSPETALPPSEKPTNSPETALPPSAEPIAGKAVPITRTNLKEKENGGDSSLVLSNATNHPPHDVSIEIWQDFLVTRSSPITRTAVNALREDAQSLGMTLEQVLKICCKHGWPTFDAATYSFKQRKTTTKKPPPAPARRQSNYDGGIGSQDFRQGVQANGRF